MHFIMKLKNLTISLVMLLTASISIGQSIFTNPITGSDPGQTSPYTTSQVIDPNITVTGISRGSGISGNAGNNRYNTKGWNSASFDANDYFEFTITPNAGYKIDFVSFVYTPQKSTTGPTNAAFRSSLSAYATNIGSPSVSSATTISLSAAPYQGRTSGTTFRLYGWGASSATGTFSVNDFTFNGIVSATCSSVAITSVTPTTGPVGTEVTINAASGLTGATATFGGISAAIVSNTTSQLVVTIPAGATTGNLIVTNASACSSIPIGYTVIKEDKSSCEGSTTPGNLFISEVTDSNSGGLTYVEIYNGTASPVSLSGYLIKVTNNAAAYTAGNTVTLDPTVTLAVGSTYVVALGSTVSPCGTAGGDGSLADQIAGTGVTSINFGSGSDDHIALFNGPTLIDSWGDPADNNWSTTQGPRTWGTEGATFRRKNTATPLPRTTFFLSDWNVTDWTGSTSAFCANNDYSDVGIYTVSKVPPIINTHPTAVISSCTTTSLTLTVNATEGVSGGNLLAFQWYVSAPGATGWTAVTNSGVYTNATTASLSISSIYNLNNYQYYCQVLENTGTCFTASNAVVIKDNYSTVWNGTVWSNGLPSTTKTAILNADYSTATNPDIDACSLKVNTGFIATITGGHYFNIVNNITNDGVLNIQNNGSLVQVNDLGVDLGNISMARDATIKKLDYVYWSSPIQTFSTNNILTGMPTGFIYKWNPTLSNPNGGQGFWESAAGNTMDPGRGYIARGSLTLNPATATVVTATFSGAKPNNGVVAQTISRGSMTAATLGSYTSANGVPFTVYDDNYNLIGNPYPSAISANSFLTYNTSSPHDVIEGAVRIWTHQFLPAAIASPFYNTYGYNYDSNDYITYNGTATTSGPSGFSGYIASGQGFFVTMHDGTAGNGTLTFNNSMRVNGSGTTNNNQFFRHEENRSENDRHRIWMDLIGPTSSIQRIVIGYVPGATFEKDNMYDAYMLGKSPQNFYSLIGDEMMCIQGRPIPFNSEDKVRLGVKIPVADTYTIAIAAVDGLFSNDDQSIYLEDRELNIIYDLKQAPYHFTAFAGQYDNRFLLRYTNNELATENFQASNDVLVFSEKAELMVKSYSENIASVSVYDVLGRKIFSSDNVDESELHIDTLKPTHQTLILKIKLVNGQTVTKKTIY